MLYALKFLHLLAMAVWVGMLIFFTFFTAPVIFKALQKEAAFDLLHSLLRNYWMVGYISGIVALLSLVAIAFIEKGFPFARISLLSFMTALTLYSGLITAARAGELKEEIGSTSDPARKQEIRKEFRTIHKKSYSINIVVLASGIFVIGLTARRFRL